jgi:hypothetical protein
MLSVLRSCSSWAQVISDYFFIRLLHLSNPVAVVKVQPVALKHVKVLKLQSSQLHNFLKPQETIDRPPSVRHSVGRRFLQILNIFHLMICK